jgi:methionine-gamma-lyase
MEKKTPSQRMRDVQDFGEQGGVVPVIDVASTSTFLNPLDMEKTFQGELQGCYLYSRHSNPTVNAFSKKLAALEGMEAALGVASGMAAISCAVEQVFADTGKGGGGKLLASKVVYGGTYALFKNVFPSQGIEVEFVDVSNIASIERAITPKTKALYLETISNPLLSVPDLSGLSKLCRKHGLKMIVDNTFAPGIISAADHGADIVLHSGTKYLSGASDLVAGAVVSSQEFINSLIDINHGRVMLKGPIMDPKVAHELYLRLDHLEVRMKAHGEAAMYFSKEVERAGLKVIYPGLESHPNYDRMKSLMNPGSGFGGMVTINCGPREKAFQLAEKLQQEKFGLYAVSLGFSRTLMSVPSVTTSSEIPEAEQKEIGLDPGLLRLSIGITGDTKYLTDKFLKVAKNVGILK